MRQYRKLHRSCYLTMQLSEDRQDPQLTLTTARRIHRACGPTLDWGARTGCVVFWTPRVGLSPGAALLLSHMHAYRRLICSQLSRVCAKRRAASRPPDIVCCRTARPHVAPPRCGAEGAAVQMFHPGERSGRSGRGACAGYGANRCWLFLRIGEACASRNPGATHVLLTSVCAPYARGRGAFGPPWRGAPHCCWAAEV